jgi:hypothetical protein
MDPAIPERHLQSWKELMDFGWRFCLEVYPQLYPGVDPLAKLHEAWEHDALEHAVANERMILRLGRPDGR